MKHDHAALEAIHRDFSEQAKNHSGPLLATYATAEKYAEHQNAALIARVAELERGIESVRVLIDSSDGVTGLHLNGDVASWESLEEGGHFEEWLMGFNNAESVESEESN